VKNPAAVDVSSRLLMRTQQAPQVGPQRGNDAAQIRITFKALSYGHCAQALLGGPCGIALPFGGAMSHAVL